jgi:hypothetical protein
LTGVVITALSFDGWRWDERLAVSVLLVGVGLLAWAFTFTAAEGALRPQRVAFRAAGSLLALAAAYGVLRAWT